MYYIVESNKSFGQASTDLETGVTQNGFGVSHVHDLGATLRSKGMAVDMRLNMALPCRISVFTEKGQTKIGLIKPVQMLAELSQDAVITQIAEEIEATTIKMVDEAK